MKDWCGVRKIQFTPKAGSDIFKVIFAEFTWVGGPNREESGPATSSRWK
jgi:hypothetical protein